MATTDIFNSDNLIVITKSKYVDLELTSVIEFE